MKETHPADRQASAGGAEDSQNSLRQRGAGRQHSLHSLPALLAQVASSKLSPSCYLVALSHCDAETGERGSVQHCPAPWWGRQVQMLTHSPARSLKPAPAHAEPRPSPATSLKPAEGHSEGTLLLPCCRWLPCPAPPHSNCLKKPAGIHHPHWGCPWTSWSWWPRRLAHLGSTLTTAKTGIRHR